MNDAGHDSRFHSLRSYVVEYYDQLHQVAARQVARENPDNSLQASALINELVVKLLKADSPLQIQDANHFLAVAATMMQHILTDRARHLQAEYTGGKMQRQDLGSQHGTEDATALHMLIIQEELDLLTQADPLAAGVVKNRCLGYSIEEAAEKLHISRSTAYSLWNFGRAWLLRRFKNISTI